MRILEVSRYKNNFAEHQLPFVTEQGEAIAKVLRDMQSDGMSRAGALNEPLTLNDEPAVEYFLVKGNYVTAVRGLKKKIREFKPDIVHAHYGLSAITAELQNLAPVVTTFHNGETHSWWVNMMTSLFSLKAKHVIYVAPHIRDLVYFKAKNYSIIPCGVSLEDCFLMDKAEARRKLGWSDDKKYIMFGGAFDNTRKNYKLLAEAVERLAMSDEGLGKSQESRVKSIECIEMKGLSRAECVLRMNACDVFALPTKNEGSPQALKEAMACNCPIVATDVADIKYLLGDLSGHYVLSNKKGNGAWWKGDEYSAEELATLLKQALAFVGRTEGRKRIIELGDTNELVAQKIIKIYQHVLEENKQR